MKCRTAWDECGDFCAPSGLPRGREHMAEGRECFYFRIRESVEGAMPSLLCKILQVISGDRMQQTIETKQERMIFLKTFEVEFRADGKTTGSIMITARDSGQARRMALGEIGGMPGYAGKRISILRVHEIR